MWQTEKETRAARGSVRTHASNHASVILCVSLRCYAVLRWYVLIFPADSPGDHHSSSGAEIPAIASDMLAAGAPRLSARSVAVSGIAISALGRALPVDL